MGGALDRPALQAVDRVDLARYAGKWYEIARLPNTFERAGSHDVTATYAYDAARGRMSVMNESFYGADRTWVAGTAVPDPESHGNGTNARLLVNFRPNPTQPVVWPLPAPYWIIELAEDYSVAVVSEPSRRTLWILARTPTVPRDTLAVLLARLVRVHGFYEADLQHLEWPKHTATAVAV